MLAADGVLIDAICTRDSNGVGIFGKSGPIYCESGSQVSPLYSTNTAKGMSGGYGPPTTFEQIASYSKARS